MKLRQRPDDFVVDEIAAVAPAAQAGPHRVFLLEKRGIETFALLRYLARENRIPLAEIGVAGIKDKHAVTRQRITVPARYELSTRAEPSFTLTPIGFLDRPLRPGDLAGNAFRITIRDIPRADLRGIARRAEGIGETGVPNYFDSQRFGSAGRGGFIAGRLARGDFEGAARLYLTSPSRSDKGFTRRERRLLERAWPPPATAGAPGGGAIRTPAMARVLRAWQATRDWRAAYEAIPGELRTMFVEAYQSFIWNECVKIVLAGELAAENLYRVPYALGELLFYRELDQAEAARLPETLITVGAGARAALAARATDVSEREAAAIERALAAEGLALADFERGENAPLFKSRARRLRVAPAEFRISEASPDELNDARFHRRFKLEVSFTLPKGSYATVVIKRLCNR